VLAPGRVLDFEKRKAEKAVLRLGRECLDAEILRWRGNVKMYIRRWEALAGVVSLPGCALRSDENISLPLRLSKTIRGNLHEASLAANAR